MAIRFDVCDNFVVIAVCLLMYLVIGYHSNRKVQQENVVHHQNTGMWYNNCKDICI